MYYTDFPMKSPSPFYLINFGYLHWLGGLMDSMIVYSLDWADSHRLPQSSCLIPGVCILFVGL